MAEGTRIQIAHVKESSWGVPSGTTFQKDRIRGSAPGQLGRTVLRSAEWRSDRGISSGRGGIRRPTLSHPFELSYGTQEDQFESALRSAWVAAAAPITALTVTVVAGTTNTMAATGIGAGIVAGDWVKVAGFVAPYLANNGFKKVTTASANLLTFAEEKDIAGSSTLAAATSQAGISVTRCGYIQTGTTEKSLTYEKGNLDIPMYRRFPGMVASDMSLSFAVDRIIEGTFNFIGQDMEGPQAGAYALGYTNQTTTAPMTANDQFAVLRIDGTPTALANSLNLNLNNNARPLDSVFRTRPLRIGAGSSNLSGDAVLHLIDSTYWTKYIAETRIALGLYMLDPAGTTGYAIDIPRIMLGDISEQEAEENVAISVPLQAEYDSTSGLVNMRISKLA